MGKLEHNGVNVPCLYDIAISCRAWCLSLISCSYPLYDCFIYNVNIIVSATQFCNFQIYICFLTVLMTVTKFQILGLCPKLRLYEKNLLGGSNWILEESNIWIGVTMVCTPRSYFVIWFLEPEKSFAIKVLLSSILSQAFCLLKWESLKIQLFPDRLVHSLFLENMSWGYRNS